jgi:hypothetical protein
MQIGLRHESRAAAWELYCITSLLNPVFVRRVLCPYHPYGEANCQDVRRGVLGR